MRLPAMGLLLVLVTLSSAAATVPHFDNPQLSARYQALTKELRCVICLNQSIASSTVPLARDMRQLVAKRMHAGDTDAEIKQILVSRYGTFVLYDPPFSPATWILWLGPLVLLLFGLLIAALLIMRSRRRRDTPVVVDRGRLDQILQDPKSGEQEP